MASAQVPLDRLCHQLLHLFIGAFDVIKARVVLLVPHQLPFLPSAVHRALLLLTAVSNFSFSLSLFLFSSLFSSLSFPSRAVGKLKIQRLQHTKANALLHVSMWMRRCWRRWSLSPLSLSLALCSCFLHSLTSPSRLILGFNFSSLTSNFIRFSQGAEKHCERKVSLFCG